MVNKKELDTYIRNEIMHELLIGLNKKGKESHGKMREIAKKYDVHWKTISRIWAIVKNQQQEGAKLNASSKKFRRNSRKKVDSMH